MKNITLSIRAALFMAICLFVSVPTIIAQSGSGDPDPFYFADYNEDTDFGNEDIKNTPVIKTISTPVTDGYLKVAYEQLDQTAELSLVSINGKKVHASNIKGDREQKGTLTIPVNNLSAGVYIVRLKNAAYNVTKRVFITN